MMKLISRKNNILNGSNIIEIEKHHLRTKIYRIGSNGKRYLIFNAKYFLSPDGNCAIL